MTALRCAVPKDTFFILQDLRFFALQEANTHLLTLIKEHHQSIQAERTYDRRKNRRLNPV